MDKYSVAAQKNQPPERGATSEAADGERFAEVLVAIQASRVVLEGQIGGVQSKVSLVRQDFRNVVDLVTEAEGRVSELEDTVKELHATVQRLSAMVGALETRAEDAENRARWNNLRFVGFPEGVEGAATESYLEDWLHS